MLPNAALYQTEPHLDILILSLIYSLCCQSVRAATQLTLAVSEKISVLERRIFSTAAPFRFRSVRHRRRSSSKLPNWATPRYFNIKFNLQPVLSVCPRCYAAYSCGQRKNFRLGATDFFDRCAFSLSLGPPPAALKLKAAKLSHTSITLLTSQLYNYIFSDVKCQSFSFIFRN